MLDTDLEYKPDSPAHKANDRLLCAACGAGITRERFATERRGKHSHTLFNPAGHVFIVRCFSEAEGLGLLGRPSRDFTWFPGTSWQIALCLDCAAHIGWHYIVDDGGDRFFGLIRQALVPEGEGD